jgi:hypothetical protein
MPVCAGRVSLPSAVLEMKTRRRKQVDKVIIETLLVHQTVQDVWIACCHPFVNPTETRVVVIRQRLK